jgi:formate hydrogenlyase subunit 4
MNLVTGFAAQLLHIALMLAAAPTLVGAVRWIEARLAGRTGPPVLQPWRDLQRLLRKELVVAESASTVSAAAPLVSAAAVAVAAALVPSFALGMTFAPFDDLVVIAGLLALARISLALGGTDAGTAQGGIDASRTMTLASLSEPALLLVVFVLALLAGSTNLDLIAAMQQESGAGWRASVSLAFAATLLVSFVDGAMRPRALLQEFSGRDLGLLEGTDALRLLLWLNLIGAMFLPFAMAPSGAGPAAWLAGFAGWLGRTLVFAVVLAVVPAFIGRIRLMRAAHMLGVAILLSLLALAYLLAGTGTA